MVTIVKLTGLLLLALVGYHYINEPLGFSVAGSVATVIFAGCLLTVYRGYVPDGKNWAGWSLLGAGCVLLAAFDAFSWWLPVPGILIVLGFRLTELTIELPRGDGDYSAGDGGGDSGGSCGGDGGGGD